MNLNIIMITKKDLVKMGYPVSTATNIIHQAKRELVENGYPLYDNKRIGNVPVQYVEKIIGTQLFSDKEDVSNGKN